MSDTGRASDTSDSGASADPRTLAIAVGGGPAPGINGVISAATIEAINSGCRVIGLLDGLRWLIRGDTSRVRELTIDDVSRIHLRGGSVLRTSRADPTRDPDAMDRVVAGLRDLEVDYLMLIGGDGTAFTARRVDEACGADVATAHVPKTIDNDLPLPGLLSTFGFQTARHVGVDIVQNLSEEAKTLGRWCLVVTMGRHTGHLALGIGKAAGATLTLIPEEFDQGEVGLDHLVDILEGSVLKRRALGRDHGVAVLAEGLVGCLRREELAQGGDVHRDRYGNLDVGSFDLGGIVSEELSRRLRDRDMNTRILRKDLGYELRSADPIPFDSEYTRNLGYGAVKFLLSGGSGAMIAVEGGRLTPIPLQSITDAEERRVRVRRVDTRSEVYEVARKYMIRLEERDFRDRDRLERLADAAGCTPSEFSDRFEYLLQGDPAADLRTVPR